MRRLIDRLLKLINRRRVRKGKAPLSLERAERALDVADDAAVLADGLLADAIRVSRAVREGRAPAADDVASMIADAETLCHLLRSIRR
ncbi:MAG: hypothetical protein B7733_05940 [Myxococcales bacterium FL481]|nr:MAG: hypothetical protein B7733_05940 [Myxococcales bacterium FL481]